eukprot:3263676-Amphidinium_carterae.1
MQRPSPRAPIEEHHHWRLHNLADSFARRALDTLRTHRPNYDARAAWEDSLKRVTTWVGHQGASTAGGPPPWLALLGAQGQVTLHSQAGPPPRRPRTFQVRPALTLLHWCHLCGAYATSAIGSLKRACRGVRRPGTAASIHPQHKQAVLGAYLEPVQDFAETLAGQASSSALPADIRPSRLL